MVGGKNFLVGAFFVLWVMVGVLKDEHCFLLLCVAFSIIFQYVGYDPLMSVTCCFLHLMCSVTPLKMLKISRSVCFVLLNQVMQLAAFRLTNGGMPKYSSKNA